MPDGARPLIRGYGDGGFRVGAVRMEGTVLVMEEGAAALPPASLEALDAGLAEDIAGHRPEILLLGTGAEMQAAPEAFASVLRCAGIAVETMATGAACRTYNVLVGDGRDVAALLLPVD